MRDVLGVRTRPARLSASDPQPAPSRRSLEPPRARDLLLLNAAPCTLLRPPSAPGCSLHSVTTAISLHPTHKAGHGIDPRQRRSARGSDSQTATPPRCKTVRVVFAAQPYLQSVAKPLGPSTHRHRSSLTLLSRAPVLLPPVLLLAPEPPSSP